MAGSQVTNASVGEGSRVATSVLVNCGVGPENEIRQAKMTLVHTERAVQVTGPTEVSEAWLGWGCHISQRGYFEWVFSNDFLVLDFDEESGQLSVREVWEIPKRRCVGR